MEIFVYVIRLKRGNRLTQFLKEYNRPENTKITPCILTFIKATSGEQLKNIINYPILLKLIDKINEEFKKNRINELEYYWRVKYECLQLSLWYIELLVLNILKYNGKYHNRCMIAPWSGEGEVTVPWIKD